MEEIGNNVIQLVGGAIGKIVPTHPKSIPAEYNSTKRGVYHTPIMHHTPLYKRLYLCKYMKKCNISIFNDNLRNVFIRTHNLKFDRYDYESKEAKELLDLVPVEIIKDSLFYEIMISHMNMVCASSDIIFNINKKMLYSIENVSDNKAVVKVQAVYTDDKYNRSHTVLYFKKMEFLHGRLTSKITLDILESLIDIKVEEYLNIHSTKSLKYSVYLLDFNCGEHITLIMRGVYTASNHSYPIDVYQECQRYIINIMKTRIFEHKFTFIK